MRKRRGFTLMEMLIVVAVIAILVAIAIPTFSSGLEKARKAACDANCRSLKGLLTVEYMTDGSLSSVKSVAADGTVTLSDEQKETYTCAECKKAGKFLTVKLDRDAGAISVTCPIHGGKSASLGDSNVIESLRDILTNSSTETLDSGAVQVSSSSVAAQVTAKLQEAGLNLGDMGAVSWHYTRSSNMFYWTSVDISDPANLIQGKNGSYTVPAMKYNFKSGNYTVYYMKVTPNHTTATSTTPFYAMDGEGSAYTPSTKEPQQTYENALKYYQEAMKASGFSS